MYEKLSKVLLTKLVTPEPVLIQLFIVQLLFKIFLLKSMFSKLFELIVEFTDKLFCVIFAALNELRSI